MSRDLIQSNGITDCIFRLAAPLCNKKFSLTVCFHDNNDEDQLFDRVGIAWQTRPRICATPAFH
jgi:hypothetical protein